jgi:hypothetical protein
MSISKLLAASAVAFGFLAFPAAAQDKMALTPGAVEQIDLAAKLTNYGIARNDPLLLLAAAKVIAALDADSAPDAPAMGTEDLVAKARELGGGNAAIGSLADEIDGEASRGLCHGPGTVYGCF